MSPTAPFLRATRPAFRSTTTTTSQFFTASIRRPATRRFQSTTSSSSSTASQAAPESWAKRMWNSPIGLKTVHFWAPVMKWGLVIAGISDFARPAENLSLTQNAALTATGLIWTRWCLIIKPKNYLLAAVNFFLGMVGIVQVSRIMLYRSSQKALEADNAKTVEQVVQA